jgi:Fe-S cluster assembly iron-binding protein IscA
MVTALILNKQTSLPLLPEAKMQFKTTHKGKNEVVITRPNAKGRCFSLDIWHFSLSRQTD